MVSDPPGKDEVLTAAVPLASVDVPRRVVPLVKVTVPVAPADKVAVKVTD